MWDTSSFDGGGGGGFVNGGGESFQSPGGKKKEQVRRVQSVVPLITRQINESPEEEFKLFGMQVQIASIVGVLRHFEVQSTKATCVVEDFSGSIKAILWLEAENDSVTALPPVKEGRYVQVFGSIRNQDGEKIIMVLRMFPVDDCNIITNHLLQVIHTRLAAERKAKGEETKSLSMASTTALSFTEMSTSNAPVSNSMGLSKIQEEVFKILQPVQDCVGLSRDIIMKHFKPNQTREVNAALEFLLNEGHAYTTIDNEHFKATDGF